MQKSDDVLTLYYIINFLVAFGCVHMYVYLLEYFFLSEKREICLHVICLAWRLYIENIYLNDCKITQSITCVEVFILF